MSRNLDDISLELINKAKGATPHVRQMAILQSNVIEILVALHDAINSPKGIVPKSADGFYSHRYYTESLSPPLSSDTINNTTALSCDGCVHILSICCDHCARGTVVKDHYSTVLHRQNMNMTEIIPDNNQLTE